MSPCAAEQAQVARAQEQAEVDGKGSLPCGQSGAAFLTTALNRGTSCPVAFITRSKPPYSLHLKTGSAAWSGHRCARGQSRLQRAAAFAASLQ